MSGAIVVPSINPHPRALATMRANAPEAEIIVVGDQKAPDELREFCRSIDARYLSAAIQDELKYDVLDFIPWNCVQRRNVGILEAIRLKADFIISADDDNSPLDDNWYRKYEYLLCDEMSLPVISSIDGWFNLGSMASQVHNSRGFPYSKHNQPCGFYNVRESSEFVGIASGFIMGDPDINATERLEKHPTVNRYNANVAGGFMVETKTTWAAINTQNTAYHSDLFPLAFVLPGVGRYDDIWAGYIAQRVMQATDYKVHFGPPAVVQNRNEHNIYRDIRDELYGMEYTDEFCQCLKDAELINNAPVLDNLSRVTEHLRYNWSHPFPHDFLRAWIDDLEGLL